MGTEITNLDDYIGMIILNYKGLREAGFVYSIPPFSMSRYTNELLGLTLHTKWSIGSIDDRTDDGIITIKDIECTGDVSEAIAVLAPLCTYYNGVKI